MCWVAATIVPLVAAQTPQEVGDLAFAGVPSSIFQRQDDGSGATTGSLNETDMAVWDEETEALCEQHLSQLSVASNPSGTAICYNLPSLDTTTGAFMADLRLYQVSTPSGDFTGIAPEEIQVGVQYDGSSVSPVQQNVETRSVKDLAKRQAVAPTLLQSYMMVGQMDMNRLPDPMTIGGIEALVMPKVTLSAGTATTTVSPNEAAFINGVFSREIVMSDFGLAQLAVDNITAQYEAGNVAFVLPGVNLLIFPIGLIITSIWTVLGFAAYGYGTYERYAYRAAYRARKVRDQSAAKGRI